MASSGAGAPAAATVTIEEVALQLQRLVTLLDRMTTHAYRLGDQVDNGDLDGVEDHYSAANGNPAEVELNECYEIARAAYEGLLESVPGISQDTRQYPWHGGGRPGADDIDGQ